jgi:hypothetical protein
MPVEYYNDVAPGQAWADAILSAIINDDYTSEGADASVTTLVQPPQVRQLLKRHNVRIPMTDNIKALTGQAVHHVLERSGRAQMIERRLFMKRYDWTISGKIDLLDDGYISDYKTTSQWVSGHGVKVEWEAQLNIYGLLCRENNIPFNGLRIVAIYLDHSKRQADLKGHGYPKKPIESFEIPVWEPQRVEEYLKERILLHQDAELYEQPPRCTTEERWQRGDSWAVMKHGNKKAGKGCVKYSKGEAERLLEELGVQYYIDFRAAEAIRCKYYCPVREVCSQARQLGIITNSQ